MTDEFKTLLTATLPREGWCSEEKALKLAELILERQPKVCVEVGVFAGRSLVPQAMALKELGQGGHITGIDPWTLDAALEGSNGKENDDWWRNNVNLEEIYRQFIMATVNLNLTYECRWVRARSEWAVNLFRDGDVDWLHLDSNHSEEVSCRDVRLWGRKMAKKSVWVMDDTDWPSQAVALERIKALGFKTIHDAGNYQVLCR